MQGEGTQVLFSKAPDWLIIQKIKNFRLANNRFLELDVKKKAVQKTKPSVWCPEMML